MKSRKKLILSVCGGIVESDDGFSYELTISMVSHGRRSYTTKVINGRCLLDARNTITDIVLDEMRRELDNIRHNDRRGRLPLQVVPLQVVSVPLDYLNLNSDWYDTDLED